MFYKMKHCLPFTISNIYKNAHLYYFVVYLGVVYLRNIAAKAAYAVTFSSLYAKCVEERKKVSHGGNFSF